MKNNKELLQVKTYTFTQLLKIQIVKYFYNLGEKIEKETLTIKDSLFPFLLGCIFFELFWIVINFIFG